MKQSYFFAVCPREKQNLTKLLCSYCCDIFFFPAEPNCAYSYLAAIFESGARLYAIQGHH